MPRSCQNYHNSQDDLKQEVAFLTALYLRVFLICEDKQKIQRIFVEAGHNLDKQWQQLAIICSGNSSLFHCLS